MSDSQAHASASGTGIGSATDTLSDYYGLVEFPEHATSITSKPTGR